MGGSYPVRGAHESIIAGFFQIINRQPLNGLPCNRNQNAPLLHELNYAKICGEQNELLRTYDSEEPIHQRLEINSINWTDSAYVATENSGQAAGFFCYSVNPEDNIGFLKFIIVDKTKQGKGYGREMLNLALQYAFEITRCNMIISK